MQHPALKKRILQNSVSHQQLLQNNSISPTTPSPQPTPNEETPQFYLYSPSRTPELRTPQIRTPEIRSPQVQTPDNQSTVVRTPENRTPRVRTPEVSSPDARTPARERPNGRCRVGGIKLTVERPNSLRLNGSSSIGVDFGAASSSPRPSDSSINMGYVVEPKYNPVADVGGRNGRPPGRQSPTTTTLPETTVAPTTPTGWAPATRPSAPSSPATDGVGRGGGGVVAHFEEDPDSVVVLGGSANAYRSFNNDNTVTSIDSASPAGKIRKMKKDMKRLVFKNGECNVSHCNIQERRRRYLADIFTTLIDIRWRWSFFIFFASFVVSWLVFGTIWYLICWLHNDLENYGREGWKPCVMEIYSFTSAFLFSIETQHTIGYGSRHTTEECPEAIVIMMIQSALGVMIQAFMVGLIFAKLARPKKRAQTLVFSKNAVICMRNGKYCLLFRVGDVRRSHLVEAHVRVMVIRKKVTREGEILPLYQYDVNVGYDDGCDRIFLVWPITICHEIDEDSPLWKITPEDLFKDDFELVTREGEILPMYQYDVNVGFDDGCDRIFLVWPITICHEIDEDSPFWDITPNDLYKDDFELVVILEGIVETTGMSTQVRTSYLPSEIYWGRCFERLVHYQDGVFKVDYSRFHFTIPIPDMPRVSPREWEEMNGSDSSSSSSSTEGSDKTRSGAVLIDIPDSDLAVDASQNPRQRDVTRVATSDTCVDADEDSAAAPSAMTTTVNPLHRLLHGSTPNGHVGSGAVTQIHSKNHYPRASQQQQKQQQRQPPGKLEAVAKRTGCEMRMANSNDVLLAMETGI